ncbi:MAG: ABC transporter permease, partial [Bacteroidota bacterium]
MNENRNIAGRLWLEWQKVNRRFYWFVLVGAPAIVFLLTTAFLLFKKESLGDLSVALIIDNSVGFCSSLLYPLLLMVIVQTQVDVEHKGNLLAY